MIGEFPTLRSSDLFIFFISFLFFFNATATTEIYTLSLHDALPISRMTGNFFRKALFFVKDKNRKAKSLSGICRFFLKEKLRSFLEIFIYYSLIIQHNI